jgi:hypothetical protein
MRNNRTIKVSEIFFFLVYKVKADTLECPASSCELLDAIFVASHLGAVLQ